MQADSQVLVCPECQQSSDWSAEVDHCPTCGGTNLVRRLGQTVCRTCESSATAEFLAVESTTDRGIAVNLGGRHRRPDDGRDLTNEVASAIDRVLGKHARRPSDDGDTGHASGGTVGTGGSAAGEASVPGTHDPPHSDGASGPETAGDHHRPGRAGRFGRGRRR
ncbi:hypothetical protein [Phytoactinopolyspora halotolerans]|uniref:Uncharacterized protein n=1 Tax=Phytoactinopolyspora halotolerans TaxID=1981512 RepID=A0A6L9SBP7_9ACTN|nr:hypothetical protein [Phytoactinopolyspora halotolerans]NEE02074.1 hypothetical protein [Phytoactinopolyspora halotolerans]